MKYRVNTHHNWSTVEADNPREALKKHQYYQRGMRVKQVRYGKGEPITFEVWNSIGMIGFVFKRDDNE